MTIRSRVAKSSLVVLGLLVLVGGPVAYAIVASGPSTRVEVYDNGNGGADYELKSAAGSMVLDFPSGDLAPLPRQRSWDILVVEDVALFGRKYRAGDRLTSDGDSLVVQSGPQGWMNDVRYRVWKLQQPESSPKSAFIRVQQVTLRSEANGNPPDGASLPFGTEVGVIEEKNDWLKVKAKQA